jgi:transcriptional regulatory protein LEU3
MLIIFRFFEFYHPYLQLLDPAISPDEYYVRSPLLFWAILSIASRRYEDGPSLLAGLSSSVLKLMWRSLSAPQLSCYMVQAILLLCVWPFPASSMWKDISFMLVTLAQTVAMQLGLHRPEIIQDFSRTRGGLSQNGIQEAVKTWSVCYIIGQRSASYSTIHVVSFKPNLL